MYFQPYEVIEIFKITKLYTLYEHLFPGSFEFNGEAHDFWECVYVKDGSLTICASERIYMLEKGDIIFHKPLEFHKYKVDADASANLFTFSFSLEGKNSHIFEDKVFKLSKKQQGIMSQLFSFLYDKSDFYGIVADRVSICDGLKFGMQEFHSLFLGKDSELIIATIVNHIYTLLLSICDNHTTTDEAALAHSDLYKRAVHFMNKNINEKLTIDDLAKQCAVSTTSLKNTFLAFSGLGVHKYFLKLKIARSIVLLSDGHSISEIAQMLGFSSQAYFSAAFKRETGIAPTKYAKK